MPARCVLHDDAELDLTPGGRPVISPAELVRRHCACWLVTVLKPGAGPEVEGPVPSVPLYLLLSVYVPQVYLIYRKYVQYLFI
jgi:hypothetical protein